MTTETEKLIEYVQNLINQNISSIVLVNEKVSAVFAGINKGEEFEILNLMLNPIVNIGKNLNIDERFEIAQGLRKAANDIIRGEN